MYNEKIKNKFIDERFKGRTGAKDAIRLFEAVSFWESKSGTDICTMPKEQLQIIVDETVSRKLQGQYNRLYILKDYAKWAIINNIPGACNEIDKIQSAGLLKVRQQLVANPVQLKSVLDSVLAPSKDQTIDEVLKCYLWLGYSGVAEKDVSLIKKEHILFDEQSIIFNNNKYPIYRESLDVIKNCVFCNSFLYVHPNYNHNIYRDRVPGDELLRGIRRTPDDVIGLRRDASAKIIKAFNNGKINIKPSFKRMYISGLFFRKYEREIAGFPVEFSDEALKLMEGKDYKLESREHSLEYIRDHISREYYLDYQRWKVAFY